MATDGQPNEVRFGTAKSRVWGLRRIRLQTLCDLVGRDWDLESVQGALNNIWKAKLVKKFHVEKNHDSLDVTVEELRAGLNINTTINQRGHGGVEVSATWPYVAGSFSVAEAEARLGSDFKDFSTSLSGVFPRHSQWVNAIRFFSGSNDYARSSSYSLRDSGIRFSLRNLTRRMAVDYGFSKRTFLASLVNPSLRVLREPIDSLKQSLRVEWRLGELKGDPLPRSGQSGLLGAEVSGQPLKRPLVGIFGSGSIARSRGLWNFLLTGGYHVLKPFKSDESPIAERVHVGGASSTLCPLVGFADRGIGQIIARIDQTKGTCPHDRLGGEAGFACRILIGRSIEYFWSKAINCRIFGAFSGGILTRRISELFAKETFKKNSECFGISLSGGMMMPLNEAGWVELIVARPLLSSGTAATQSFQIGIHLRES